MKPYIGITDFTSREQTLEMLRFFKKAKKEAAAGKILKHRLMIGVMMSRKTLNGIKSRWSNVFPPKEKVGEIFERNDLLLNTLHYADYEGIDIARNISDAIFWGGTDIDAIQLDMVWPDPGQVAEGVHRSRKNLKVILQVGSSAFGEIDHSPQRLAEFLGDYGGLIHGVLLDQSMGQGRPLDSGFLMPQIRAIKNKLPELHVAVAGGLGPGTVGNLLTPLLYQFDLSFDAQGRLRSSGDAKDPIDWNLAKDYIKEALHLLRGILDSIDAGVKLI